MQVNIPVIPSPFDGVTILLADDEPEIRGYLEMALRCKGFSVLSARDGEEALDYLHGVQKPSLVLLDVMMPRKNGLDTLRQIRLFDQELPVIMLSCASSPLTVVEAMKSGATDFLPKPVSHDDLGAAVLKALSSNITPARTIANAISSEAQVLLPFLPFAGSVERILASIGSSTVPVLIQGETGVGKEVVARRLHAQSERADKPFLKLNCAALPAELIESELFGYERGAFTGAVQRKPGMFDMADGGTILLDEIGDMEYRLQAKLLHVLQDHEFQRLGGKDMIRVDIRVIAATHCDLQEAIATKRFREDLYYRLNVVSIRIPPLRERRQDILPLSEFLLRKHSALETTVTIPREMNQALIEYPWPGNVRELENVMRRFLVLRDADSVIDQLRRNTSNYLSTIVAESANPDAGSPLLPKPEEPTPDSILTNVYQAQQAAETEAIISALNATRWNRKKAAMLLRIDYKALLYKIKKLGIEDAPD